MLAVFNQIDDIASKIDIGLCDLCGYMRMRDGENKPVAEDSQGWAVVAEQVMGLRRELGELSSTLRRVQGEQSASLREVELKHERMLGTIDAMREARLELIKMTKETHDDFEKRVRDVESKQDQAKGALWGMGAVIAAASGVIAWIVSLFSHK